MPGIYVMAIVAAVLGLAAVGTAILLLSKPRDRLLMAVLMLVQLPMSAAGITLLRKPLDAGLQALSPDPAILSFVQTWYAPITEEPLKLLPLLVPFAFRRVTPGNAVAVGLALGLGFGIGEIGFIAWAIAQNPKLAALGPEMFGGFVIERVMVCFLHGAMTATAVWLWLRRARWGILAAMGLHYALNFPVYLASQQAFVWERPLWIQIAFAWVMILTGLMVAWVVWMARRSKLRAGPG